MKQKFQRYLSIYSSILFIIAGVMSLILTYQSTITFDVIQMSLTRHAEQLLIERATQSVIEDTLSNQLFLGWFQATGLIVAGIIMGFLSPEKPE